MIYKKIIEYCSKNNISLSAFEKKCGIGNGTISRWENESNPSIDSLEKIASVTGIPLSDWLKGSEVWNKWKMKLFCVNKKFSEESL